MKLSGREPPRLEEVLGAEDVGEPLSGLLIRDDFVEEVSVDRPHLARGAHLVVIAGDHHRLWSSWRVPSRPTACQVMLSAKVKPQ
jgi:hypothetical protein